MDYGNLPLTNNELAQQFELKVDGHTAFIEYKLSGNRIFLLHTEVPPALEGKGVGNAIVEKTLHYIDEKKLKLVPLCPFVKAYIKRHREWSRLFEKGISL